MSLFDKGCGCNNVAGAKDHDMCDGCVCDQLRNLRAGEEVDLIIDGVEFAGLTFTCFDKKTCCATFLDATYPFIVDCRKVDAIRILS
ncbi:hydrolase [Bacillus sp. Marseille-Q3570]|uniref:hydrolase n=1 Tax=Bacillus sp. Marseille-Q3570 TaxID=2963522 RepID=UPI0021B6F2B2|nr:hydrolase [Bacillus sp. Marseille-Q3570]